MEIYTIGFTKKSASEFFGRLKEAGIKRLIDVRLKNVSQLAGFAKAKDLQFFLREICGAEYIHELLLAPTKNMLDTYRGKDIDWDEYKKDFLDLLAERKVEEKIDKNIFNVPTVLLCSEPEADRCHRSIILEYLNSKWGGIEIVNL